MAAVGWRAGSGGACLAVTQKALGGFLHTDVADIASTEQLTFCRVEEL